MLFGNDNVQICLRSVVPFTVKNNGGVFVRFGAALVLAVLWFCNAAAFSQTAIQSIKTSKPPKIDGRLESLWDKAAIVSDFVQRIPNTGEPMTENTVFYVLYDENNLYLGFKCYDSQPGKITAKELARDVSLRYDDKVQIIIDTYFDKRNAYWFQINPRGCIGDALVSQNGSAFNKSWDGLWDGKAHITDWGWEGEAAIPFKTMSFRQGQSTWGLKFIRQVSRKNETGYWPTANLDSYRFQVSDAGLLENMHGMSQGIGLDVVPYAIVGSEKNLDSNREFPGDVGFDAFYQITPGLKSALTMNTDFAQTEVDDRRVNLTRFRLFFPEKRDFFLDGANYFNFGISGDRDNHYAQAILPFFSRRMGLDNDGNPLPILGGLKLTGQAGRWNMGFLDIVEERPDGKVNSAVGRVTRNIGAQSNIGAIATLGEEADGAANTVAGVDARLGSSTFLGNKNVALALFGLASQTEDSTGAGHAYGVSFMVPNDFIWVITGFHEISENFDAGLGFVPRTGIRQSYFRAGVGARPKKWGLLKNITGVDASYLTDMQNTLLTRELGVMPVSAEFLSGESVTALVYQDYERLQENFDIHEDHSIPVGSYSFWRYLLQASTAQRRNIWAAIEIDGGQFYTGTRNQYAVEFGCKIGVPILLGGAFEHNDVSLATGEFTTDVARLNLNLLFSPDVFFYNYVQYDNLSKEMGWQSRFVWIIKPGREIFLVWKSISDDPFNRFEITENSTRLKLKYTIRF